MISVFPLTTCQMWVTQLPQTGALDLQMLHSEGHQTVITVRLGPSRHEVTMREASVACPRRAMASSSRDSTDYQTRVESMCLLIDKVVSKKNFAQALIDTWSEHISVTFPRTSKRSFPPDQVLELCVRWQRYYG